MKTRNEILGYIRNLPESDALLAEIDALVLGHKPPYVDGAEKPVMKKPQEKQMVEGKINPAFLVELRDIAIDFNIQWQNWFGRQWPGYGEQMVAVTKMADQAGIDLASYAPEVLSLSDLKTVDSVMEATATQLKQLQMRILKSHEFALQNISDAKKKRWAYDARSTRPFLWSFGTLPSTSTSNGRTGLGDNGPATANRW